MLQRCTVKQRHLGHPVIPLVRMLTAQIGDDAKKYVHWGATSQDAIDTALMLQMRDGIDLLASMTTRRV